MIDEIQVSNVALIRNASLEPAQGLTVLTGETGAGKTALLSALKLLCGERSDVQTVREGTPYLLVEGRLYGENDDEGMVVSRRVGVDGRSRVTIDGVMASVKELAEKVGSTVDLCGQHEHQRLLKPSSHVGMLDSWAAVEIEPLRQVYGEALKAADFAAVELARIKEAQQDSSSRLDEARFILQRIDEVNPLEGEYEELLALLSRSEHAESLAVAADTAHNSLAGEGGAIDAVHTAVVALESAAQVDEKLGEQAAILREATYILEDVAREALQYRDAIEYDPETLAANQERLSAMQGLMRSYGPRMEDVLARRIESAEFISLIDDSAGRKRAAQRMFDQAEAALGQAADNLDAARTKAAPKFSDAVNAQMMRLEMGGASIDCAIDRMERARWTAAGPSRTEFLFRPAEGLSARPLTRIASGGEVSRVMLAIKVVLGGSDEVDTLVFDEVDAGVGGATAVALASVLADLAKTHQVIVVTHLAQVAVVGNVHYLVTKHDGLVDSAGNAVAGSSTECVPETTIRPLVGKDRVEEIARMLSGDVSEASLVHAAQMLDRACRVDAVVPTHAQGGDTA